MMPVARKFIETWTPAPAPQPLYLTDGATAIILLFVSIGVVWLAVSGADGFCSKPMPEMRDPTSSVTVPALKDE